MIRTTRLQASRPFRSSALLKIVSADPVRHDERNPQIAALRACCLNSSMKWHTTPLNASSVTVVLSCFSAHFRMSSRAGTLLQK